MPNKGRRAAYAASQKIRKYYIMVTLCHTVTFSGIEATEIEVQCSLSSGLPAFNIVGLADKTVAESKERIRAAFFSMGMVLPTKRITINLAPADIPKEGSHYDLPIAIALLSAMDVIPEDEVEKYTIIGELSLDGRLNPVCGAISAAIKSAEMSRSLICPASSGQEAAMIDTIEVISPETLVDIVNHMTGKQIIAPSSPLSEVGDNSFFPDFCEVKGQETAKRAMEIAAAGGHNILMVGPPGSGKSMLANRLSGILPHLSSEEAFEVMQIHSIAGLGNGRIPNKRPFRNPHHTASTGAMVGGGRPTKPGEITLAHNGVLFLDELPEFSPAVLETLRQPLESQSVTIARVHNKVIYPARNQLVAAMNPCKCGYLLDPIRACSRAPGCALKYQSRISGPLMDRIDIHVQVQQVNPIQLETIEKGETSSEIFERVKKARNIQNERYSNNDRNSYISRKIRTNSDLNGSLLEDIARPDKEGLSLLRKANDKLMLTARSYHKVMSIARTIADLDMEKNVLRAHIAEALTFRQIYPRN